MLINNSDSMNFEAVDVKELQRAHEAQQPIKASFPHGVVFEELKAGTGAFRKFDPRKGTTLEHSETIVYQPTLTRQYLAQRAGA